MVEPTDKERTKSEAVEQKSTMLTARVLWACHAFNATPEEAVRLLGTGELGCHYTEDDAREWLKAVKFATTTKGVDQNNMESVVKVLQGAGVVDPGTTIRDGDGVVRLAQ